MVIQFVVLFENSQFYYKRQETKQIYETHKMFKPYTEVENLQDMLNGYNKYSTYV